jgi:hypothetical protein
VTVFDETGWEFESVKRVYTNFGLAQTGETTGVAWKIVRRSPDSTALRPEEVRMEKMVFAVEPRDGKRFTVKAAMSYHYAPVPGGGSEGSGLKMAEAAVILPGKRP